MDVDTLVRNIRPTIFGKNPQIFLFCFDPVAYHLTYQVSKFV